MIKSRFRFTAYIVPILTLVILLFLISLIGDRLKAFTSIEGGIFVCILLLFMLIMLFTDMRTKVIVVTLNKYDIRIHRFIGFGTEKIYKVEELDGFHTSTITGNGTYRTIYFIKANRKVGKISEFYHSNYNDMHKFCIQNLNDLGFTRTNIITEIKDIYK